MNMPDVDEIEIAGAAKSIRQEYGNLIGEQEARNVAYHALIGARTAKLSAVRSTDKRG